MTDTHRTTTLAGMSPSLFLLGGAVLVVFALHSALQTLTGTSYPVVQELIAPAGFLIGVLGLIGRYPAHRERAPRLGRVAAVVAGLSAVNWTVVLLKNMGGAVGVVGELGTLTMATGILAFVTMFLAFVLSGLAGYRAEGVRRSTWGLMLLEGAIWLHILVVFLTPLAIPLFVFEIGHSVTHLGIGLNLRRSEASHDRAEPTPDPTD